MHHRDSHPNPHIIHYLQILTFLLACQLSGKPLLRVPSLLSRNPIHRVDHWCQILLHFQTVLKVLVLLLLLVLFQNLCRFLLPIGFGIPVCYTHIEDACMAAFPEPMAACITPLLRAPGAQIPGLPDGWMPPKEPDNWGGYVPKIGSGAPLLDEIDHPGGWNLYSFTPKYEKGKYISHQTPAGAIVAPENADGERVVGNWKFHYNGWWPSKFDRNTYVRGSAKNGDMKPKDRMGCLDVDVLKKHGCNAERVKNNPLFFFTMLCPICPPSAIQGEKVSLLMISREIQECHIILHWFNLPTSMQP